MNRPYVAYLAPFGIFMLLMAATPLVARLGGDSLVGQAPEQLIFPLQTILCGAVLAWFWRTYEIKTVINLPFALLIAFVTFLLWVAPQAFFHAPARTAGFDPTIYESRGLIFGVLFVRFLRLVVVVPLLEEIFWRGFLLRDLISRDFTTIRIGTFSWYSFGAVTVLFGLAHWGERWTPGPDFGPALLAGALFNLVAYRTRSLSACILTHAVTNLLLGFYILRTGQWGFW